MGVTTMSDGFNPKDLLIDDNGDVKGTQTFKSVLGIQREVFQCPTCNEPCEESLTYNRDTAAFDGGSCPSWYCDSCDSHFVREDETDMMTVDLYDRQ